MATEDQLRSYLKRATVELTETRRRLDEVEQSSHEPIAIIGMACRYPGATTVEDYWDLLRESRSGVVEVPAARWNVDDYYNADRRVAGGVYTRHGSFLSDIAGWDAEFFGASPHEALRMDPQQRLLMELVWEGLENAGTAPEQLAGSRTAVMVGLMDTAQYGRLQLERYGPGVAADPYFGQGVTASVVAGRLSYQFDLRGPAITLDTACSSSLVGVHLAAQALRRGECDLAIGAGAFLIMHPDTYVQSCATSMLSADGRCKTFDSSADGYVLGEGGGLVVLERLSDALANNHRIRAVLRGSAVNQDGRSNGLTAPSRSAQVAVIRAALADATVTPDEVDYVEAHGSGTKLGDAIELSALHDVFGGRSASRPLQVGAVKTNLGHTQSAAGVAGLIKTVLLLEHGMAPANLNTTQPSDAVPADGTIRPVTSPTPLRPIADRPIAGVSGFGWSGTNGHLVLQAAVPVVVDEPAADAVVLPLSAADRAALGAQLERLAQWLTERPELSLADVAHTLSSGRAAQDYRRVLVCTGVPDAISQLHAVDCTRAVAASARPRVAFLLPGVGDQYAGLGRELYRTEPVYAAAVEECIALVQQRCGVDLRPALLDSTDGRPADGDFAALLGRNITDEVPDPMGRAEIAHPFLFTVEYALATLLAHRGVRPDVLVGYSLGEYVAACLAGVFSLSDALYLVVERARLIAAAPAGRMLAVAADEASTRSVLADSGAEVDVAAVNGPTMTVLSGPAGPIEAVAATLHEAGIASRPLRTEHAFHSTLLEPARDKLAALLDTVARHAPSVAVVSNSTGAELTAEQAMSREYWADHLIRPVRFSDGVRHCAARGVDVYVELGAGQTLGGLVRQNTAGTSTAAVLGTLPARWSAAGRPDERVELLTTCAQLWELGVRLDWTAFPGAGARVVTLPGYPFQRTAFWPEPADGQREFTGARPAARPSEPADHCYAPVWRRTPRRATADELSLPGALVVFADRDGIGSALADRAEAAGITVLEVLGGDISGDNRAAGTGLRRVGRRMMIDPRRPEHYREVFAGLGESIGPLHVVHLWSLLAGSAVPVYASDDELLESIEHGFDTLLPTVQALGGLAAGAGVRLLTVSRGASEVLGDDVPAPFQAAVHGFGRVVQHEYPGLTWRGIDLDAGPQAAGRPTGDAAAVADQLAHELVHPAQPEEQLVAWRRGRRWAQEWAEIGTGPSVAATGIGEGTGPAWRADGVYLITGGTRGLGMALARRLVAEGVRRLALVGRGSGANNGFAGAAGSFSDATSELDARLARSRGDIAELEAAGAEVLVLTADAGVPAQLRRALRECREHFGALHGVVHAAGAPASGMAQRQTVAEARAVLAPKILAMGVLAELVGPVTPADQRPELLVLYSSAVTAFGGIGEGDYCAANTVLDAYGAALSGSAPSTRVLSVAWGPWQHDDWQLSTTSDLAERARGYRKRYGFADDAGCAFLDRLVATGQGSVVAVRQPMADALLEWSAMLDVEALVDASAALPAGERFARPQLRTPFVGPRTELETVVAGVWGAYLGIDQVGVHDPFFDLGGNSLVGMAMVRAVESQLDLHIAPAVLFEHPTVAEFAAAIGDSGGSDDAASEVLATSSDRGQRRRRARTGNRK